MSSTLLWQTKAKLYKGLGNGTFGGDFGSYGDLSLTMETNTYRMEQALVVWKNPRNGVCGLRAYIGQGLPIAFIKGKLTEIVIKVWSSTGNGDRCVFALRFRSQYPAAAFFKLWTAFNDTPPADDSPIGQLTQGVASLATSDDDDGDTSPPARSADAKPKVSLQEAVQPGKKKSILPVIAEDKVDITTPAKSENPVSVVDNDKENENETEEDNMFHMMNSSQDFFGCNIPILSSKSAVAEEEDDDDNEKENETEEDNMFHMMNSSQDFFGCNIPILNSKSAAAEEDDDDDFLFVTASQAEF